MKSEGGRSHLTLRASETTSRCHHPRYRRSGPTRATRGNRRGVDRKVRRFSHADRADIPDAIDPGVVFRLICDSRSRAPQNLGSARSPSFDTLQACRPRQDRGRRLNSSQVADAWISPLTNLQPPSASGGNMYAQRSHRTPGWGAGW
jgi:hypothetical protein